MTETAQLTLIHQLLKHHPESARTTTMSTDQMSCSCF